MKRALLILMCALAWVGCGDDDGTEPGDIAGRYELRTVNGGPLPYTLIALGNDRAEILSGFLQINADGTYSSSLTTRITQGSSTSTDTDTESGTWTLTGNQVSIRGSTGTTATGVVAGNQITAVLQNSISVVFSK